MWNNRLLYYVGFGLVGAGISLMLNAAYQVGREHGKHKTVWAEAVGDTNNASSEQ